MKASVFVGTSVDVLVIGRHTFCDRFVGGFGCDRRAPVRHYIDGGITIQNFLRARLIQRLVITRVPVLIGDGIPLVGLLPHDVRLLLTPRLSLRPPRDADAQSIFECFVADCVFPNLGLAEPQDVHRYVHPLRGLRHVD